MLLLLIDAPLHTLDTQYHCMKIVEKTTQLLNPGQIFVNESDQPIYRLLKEFQWRFSNRFGPEKYFCLFGSLHLEKSILLVMASCELSIVGLSIVGLFGVIKSLQKGKVLYSSCNLCHVLTINITPREKWWQRHGTAMNQMMILLVPDSPFSLQSCSKYMIQTLVLVWNSTLREKFNFYFTAVFC